METQAAGSQDREEAVAVIAGRPVWRRSQRSCSICLTRSSMVERVETTRRQSFSSDKVVAINTFFYENNPVGSVRLVRRMDRRWLSWIILGLVLCIVPGLIILVFAFRKKETVLTICKNVSWFRGVLEVPFLSVIVENLTEQEAIQKYEVFVGTLGQLYRAYRTERL